MISLDIYDERPREMNAYLRHNGWNFNRKVCEFAIRMMRKRNTTTGAVEPIEMKTRDEVDAVLAKHNVKLNNNKGYNYVYVFHMAMADYLKSSVPDEEHLARFVKDFIDDEDNPGGNVMRKWYADMIAKEIPVDWAEIL